MDYSIFRFTLNMHTHRSQAMVKVFKGDTAVKLIITITDGGNVYKFGSGCTATLTGTKANEEKISHSCTITDNTIIYLFDGETTDCSGIVTCEITLYDSNGGVITAPKFTIAVDEKEVEGGSIPYEYSAESLATLMGAAAGEYAREVAEEVREANEKERQESYTEAEEIATEAKGIAETANNTSNAANTKSDTALATAETAEFNSNTAKTNASNALNVAGEAKTAADKAVAMFDSVSLSYNNTEGKLYFNYTASDGTSKSVPADLDLERSIIGIDDKVENGTRYLELTLSNGVTKKIKLDEIFHGFVKTSTDKNVVYAKDAEGNECTIPIDSDRYETGKIVRRKSDDRIAVGAAEDDVDALPLGQAKQMFITRYDGEDMGVNSVFTLDTNGDVWNVPYGKEVVGTYIVARDNYGGILVPENPTESNHSVSKSYVDKAKEEVDFRLDQLESATLKFTEYSGITDELAVPANAAKNVPIYKIGGMTYKSENRLRPIYSSVENGPLTIIVNEDYSITINGDTNDQSYAQRYIHLLDEGGGHNGYLHFGVSMPAGIELYTSHYDEENDFTDEGTTSFEGSSYTYVSDDFSYSLAISSGTYNNFTIYPMLTNSATAPDKYVPYFEGLRDTKVTELVSEGANLLNTLADESVPSNTNMDASTTRIFTPNTLIVGISYNNYYRPEKASLLNQNKNSVTFTCVSGYGVGFAFDLKPNTQYTLSCEGNVAELQIGASLYNFDGSLDTYKAVINKYYTFTTNACGKTLISFNERTSNSSGISTEVTVSNVMLAEGTSQIYKPYRAEAVDTFPISAELRAFLEQHGYGRGVEGYEGYIDFERKVFIPPQTHRIVLNGTENWIAYTSFYYISLSTRGTSNSAKNFVCSHFGREGENANYFYVKDNLLRAYVTNQFASLEEWKAYLANNSVLVEYATESVPEPIDISAYLTDDNFIEVEGGGVIVPRNDYGNPAFIEALFTEKK